MRRQMWMPEIGIWSQGKIAAHFALAAHVEGQITSDQLQDAVQRLTRRHPLLTARVVAEPDYSYWFDTDDTDPIETRIVPRVDDTTWLAATAETVGPLFNFERGPLARVTLVQSADRCEIILAVHHCLADGLSAAYALHDLLVLLGDPAADLPELNVSRCPADLLPRWIRTLAGIVPVSLVFPVLRQSGPLPPIPDFNTKTGDFHIRPWALPPEQTQAIAARGRSEGVTVHSILATAFLRAWGDVTGGKSHSASCPVSLRDYFTEPVGMALGLMIWPYNKVTLPTAPDAPFWDQARQFQRDFKRQISAFKQTFSLAVGHRMLSHYSLEHVAAAFDLETESTDHTLSITNLGRLSLETEYGPLRLVGFYGPLLDASDQEVVLGIATTNGTLSFAMTFREPILAPATAERIREAVEAQLNAALT